MCSNISIMSSGCDGGGGRVCWRAFFVGAVVAVAAVAFVLGGKDTLLESLFQTEVDMTWAGMVV